ncbi:MULTISPECIES: phage major capsid protein [unclassified Pseudomonas]|uniref:Putative capsid protein n=6 Tax=root TaxID=1 RepID=A0A6M3M7Y2_9ZZZZ|nr:MULTISPECIES: phage major capsid protein [unclassified Pseudomonas]MBU0523495.1 phage major capsid protein [Gammaproteobacteria bacterium]MBU0819925.1 phage major capsid protein [Gammaproteobacteria bacterium]MBU0842048.1 phage major capsid protein [Gammaproteobacteria bacterium]MBU1842875.1 phage major capsid protein [Gammaproteobacteria bacterium]PMV78185.1 phage major capsid protein [Pseudomonas sp. GW101-1A09]
MHDAMSNQARAEDRQMHRKEHADDKVQLKAVNDLLDQRDQEIKAFAEKANKEIKEHGTILTETKTILDGLVKDGLALQDRFQDIEQKLARRFAANDPSEQKSVGEQLSDSDDYQALTTKGRGIARLNLKAVTNITSATTGTGGVGVGIQPTRVAGIITDPERQFTIRDLIMPGRTGSNAVEFVQETGFQNMAAPQAGEGALKAQSDLSFGMVTTTVKTIAHWFKASKQVLSDIPLLQSYINGRAIYGLKYKEEEQILAGDGTGQNLLGLIPQATTFNEALRKAGDTKIDTLRRAILQVRVAEYRASAIALNPVDWADIELTKDSTGSYIWVNVQEGGVQRLWKLPVVDSNAVPEGEFLVGAMNIAAQVFDREDAAVEVSTEDGDNFRTNMVTIRAEERLALAVYRPESFVHGEFEDPTP